DDLVPAIVSVKAGFGDHDSDLAGHGRQVYGCDAGMKLTVAGCSPAWPNPGGAQSGYLLESDGKRLLLDCGPGVLARLREREPWPEGDGIALPHWRRGRSRRSWRAGAVARG